MPQGEFSLTFPLLALNAKGWAALILAMPVGLLVLALARRVWRG